MIASYERTHEWIVCQNLAQLSAIFYTSYSITGVNFNFIKFLLPQKFFIILHGSFIFLPICCHFCIYLAFNIQIGIFSFRTAKSCGLDCAHLGMQLLERTALRSLCFSGFIWISKLASHPICIYIVCHCHQAIIFTLKYLYYIMIPNTPIFT